MKALNNSHQRPDLSPEVRAGTGAAQLSSMNPQLQRHQDPSLCFRDVQGQSYSCCQNPSGGQNWASSHQSWSHTCHHSHAACQIPCTRQQGTPGAGAGPCPNLGFAFCTSQAEVLGESRAGRRSAHLQPIYLRGLLPCGA